MKILIANRYANLTRKYLIVFVLAMVLLPISPAHALLGGGSDISTVSCVLSPIDCTLNLVRSFLVNLIVFVGSGVDYALHMETTNAVVTSSWGIVRGFSNMFFILTLIIMAFATIFNVAKYDFRTLIARFLIAVLLINFSLVIGELIIDWSQSLSNVFLDAIGDVGARVAQGANIAKNLDAGTIISAPIDQVSWGETMKAGINIIMLAIIFFSLLVLLVFAVIRVPILWALLIVSPIAWITYILPTTMDVNRRWWKYFLGWNAFMPIYLFFIYFGVLFLNNQNEVLANLGSAQLATLDYTFKFLFFYILIAIFLIGGAKFAMSSSMAAGAGGVAGAIWAKGRTTARFAGVGLARRTPGIKQIEPMYKAAGQRISQWTKESEEAVQKKQAVWAERWGVKGAGEQQLAKNVDIEVKKLKEKGIHLNRTQLETMLNTGSPTQKIAAAQVWAEENYGALEPSQVTGLRNAFGQNINTSLAASVFRKQKWGEMSADQLRELLDQNPTNPNRITDENIRSLLYGSLIEKGRANTTDIQDALGLAKSDGQRAGIIKKSNDILKNAANENQRLALFRGLGAGDNETRREMLKLMAGTGDSFFLQDNAGNPLNLADRRTRLRTLTEQALSEPERKKFLEEVSEKYALDAANVMVDLGLLRDATGTPITRATANAENLALDQVHSKLSIEKKLSQHRSQTDESVYQRALGRDMRKNIQGYTSHDKYASAQPRILEAQREARHYIFQQENFRPFVAQIRQLKDRLNDLRAHPPTTQALPSIKQQLQNTMLRKLVDLRNDYEKLCIKQNLMTEPVDRTEVEADLRKLDLAVNSYTNQVANL